MYMNEWGNYQINGNLKTETESLKQNHFKLL